MNICAHKYVHILCAELRAMLERTKKRLQNHNHPSTFFSFFQIFFQFLNILLFLFLCYANQPYIVVKICACVMRYHLFILFLALKNGKELSCQINISIQNETVLWQYTQFVNPIRLFQIILKNIEGMRE